MAKTTPIVMRKSETRLAQSVALAARRSPVVKQGASAANLLQSRLGNAGTKAFLARVTNGAMVQRAASPIAERTIPAPVATGLLAQEALHPKLKVGAANDPLEREADAAAERVMRIGDGPSCAFCRAGGGYESGPAAVRRAPASARGVMDLPPEAEDQARRLTQGGEPLSGTVRASFEPRFGADFSGVRVHHDAAAAESARVLRARAWTLGNHIAFGAGQWAPGKAAGERLLAHELAHTLQQEGGSASAGLTTQLLSTGQSQGTPVTRPALMRSPLDVLGLQGVDEPVPAAPLAETIITPTRINAPSSPGWQSVDPQYILIKKGEPVELPHLLKLDYQDDKCKSGKTRWKVAEGRYNDHEVCISADETVAASSAPIGAAATAKFDIANGQFWYGGMGPIDATTHPTNPIPKGTHDIEIPDFHHASGAKYGDYATTWFRLGHSGDRYLHPGRVSLGCTTIKAISEWPIIWKYFISSRKDHQNVGELEVI
jgi:hypothetical protein